MIPIIALGLTAVAGIIYLILGEYKVRKKHACSYHPRTATERIAEGISARASGKEPITPAIVGDLLEDEKPEPFYQLDEADDELHLPETTPMDLQHPELPLSLEWEGWLYIPEKLTRVTFEDIKYHIHSLSQLPSNNFPALKEIESTKSSADDVAHIIQCDWNLSSRILKLANSAFYSTDEDVTDVKRAITLLGFETVRSLIYVNMILDGLSQNLGPVSSKQIFSHCLATSCAASHFANRNNPASKNLVATAALFHDIGKLACAKINRLKTEAALDAIDQDTPFDRTQLDKFGISHYLITKMLLDIWHFPDALTRAIIGLAPDAPPNGDNARALRASSMFASHIGYTACGTEMDSTDYDFGLSPEEESVLAENIRSRVDIFTKI
jgi:putative nucleotidyltransferase with HDIG domain